MNSRATLATNNPFNNQVVIDHIWSFLPRKDLLNCRFVAKENWNSASVRRLKKLKPFTSITLNGDEIIQYRNFLSSRDKSIEWYPQNIKYNFKLTSKIIEARTRSGKSLLSAQEIVQDLGPDCVESIWLELPALHSSGGDPDASNLIEKITHGANLQMLTLRFHGEEVDIQMLTRILNSTKSINTLILHPYGSVNHCPPSYAHTLLALGQVNQNVLDSIEKLEIKIPDPSCFEVLAKISLPNMKRLHFSSVNDNKWKFPDDWQHFQDIMKISCPSLVKCQLKHRIGFFGIFEHQGINFRDPFPNIEFPFKKLQTAIRHGR